jgi:uncharacterized membrane protein
MRNPAREMPFFLGAWREVIAPIAHRPLLGLLPDEVLMNRASIAGHPIHPMLVTLPIGLWVFSLVCDLVYVSSGDAQWHTTAYLTLGGGIVGALLAAVPGLIDLLTLREGAERRTGVTHMVLNLAIVAVQAINFWLRSQPDSNANLAIGLSVLAVVGLVFSGWLGGHLVHVLGVTQPHRDPTAAAAQRDRLQPRT